VVDGPHEIALAPGRPIYYARPAGRADAAPLVAHLHGQCGPPAYACGSWLHAAVDVGVLVCPTGNARCGDSPVGPPSWEGPSWKELATMMDADLEASIAKVQAIHPNAIRRDRAVLTGYSRGGFAVPILAARHPKRWPYLIVIEADATLTAVGLRRAGVVAVALVAGELGDQIAGMQKSADDLVAAGFPARLFVMPKTGHLYSSNMEDVMKHALDFVLSRPTEEADATAR
jgi:pimeloyl-ACP methyl ester carboxylesterase